MICKLAQGINMRHLIGSEFIRIETLEHNERTGIITDIITGESDNSKYIIALYDDDENSTFDVKTGKILIDHFDPVDVIPVNEFISCGSYKYKRNSKHKGVSISID